MSQTNPMGAKSARRVQSEDRAEAYWRRWLQPIRQARALAWTLAFLLAIGLAVCEADLLMPQFWQRRLQVQLAFCAAAAILQTPLLVGSVQAWLHRMGIRGDPMHMFGRAALGAGLGTALLALIWAAGLRLLEPRPAQTPGIGVETRAWLDAGTEWTFLALLVVLVALTACAPLLKGQTPQQRLLRPLRFMAAGFAIVYLVNTLLPMMDLSSGRIAAPEVVPAYSPGGMDFRRGMYLPAQRLLAGENIYPLDAAKSPNVYPPLVTLMGTIFLLLSEDSGVVANALVLFAANVLCLTLAAGLGNRMDGKSDSTAIKPTAADLSLLVLVGVSLFAGYPFLFSFERGNIDAIAMLLAVAAYGVLAAQPGRLWLQIILLSLAIHIKAYPALLLLPLLIVHKQRLLAPALLVNVALLLCLGPLNAAGFFASVLKFYAPIVWVGNHSAFSFAGILAGSLGADRAGSWILLAALMALPLALWGLGLREMRRFKTTRRLAAAALILTTPVMAVLPGISYDYQLVIVYAPILLMLALIVESMQERQEPEDYLLLLLVLLAAAMIGRSFMIMPGVSPWVQNKYVWLILLQTAGLAQILRNVRMEAAPARGRAASIGE